MPLKTRTCPAWVSARKMSPFGATRITRGIFKPSAKSPTWKPAGACGSAPAGLGTIRDLRVADSVMNGFGKSAVVILRNAPGLIPLDVTNAEWPVRTLAGLASPSTSPVAPAASSEATRAVTGRLIVFMIFFRQYIAASDKGKSRSEREGLSFRPVSGNPLRELSILEHRKRNGGEVFRVVAVVDGNAVATAGGPDLNEVAAFFSATENQARRYHAVDRVGQFVR